MEIEIIVETWKLKIELVKKHYVRNIQNGMKGSKSE